MVRCIMADKQKQKPFNSYLFSGSMQDGTFATW